MSWLDRPKMALDTETTGVNTSTDRIITCCLGLSTRVGDWQPQDWLINPGVPIPEAATAVHGIGDGEAAEGMDPREALAQVYRLLGTVSRDRFPIVGHNVAFDVSILDAEFRRHLGKPIPEGLLFIDTLLLAWRFHKSTGSRRLEALAERHGITFPAHDATADALASLRLLHIMAGHDELLPHLSLTGLQELQREWHDQRQDQIRARAEGAGYPITDEPSDWPLRAA